MKAIVTKYHAPTATKPAKIVATDSDGNRVSISPTRFDSDWSAHDHAAKTLCIKMGWTRDSLMGGDLKPGQRVYVSDGHAYRVRFTEDERRAK